MARKLVAEAVIKAVDRFSGPMKRIGRHMARSNKSFARAGAAARRAGRSLGVGVTMPAAAIGRSLFGAALEFDRMRNSAQAAGRLTNEQIKPVELLARKLGSTTQFTASQAMGAARMLYKAGFDTERVMGTLKGTLDLAAAGELELADAADIATNVLTGMGMEMKTQEQATKSLTRVNDALAYAASNSNTDVRNLGESFKYAGPLASMVGASVEDLSAMFMTMASRGIKGSEAGVAVRSALVRMLRPTKAMQAALAGLNIDLADFKTGAKQADASGLVKSYAARGFDLSGVKGQLKALFADKSLQEDPSEFFKQLNATIAKGLGDTSTMGLDKSAKALNDYFAGLADKVDMPGFFAALKKAGASAGDISRIFDARQGARLATLVATDELLVNLKKLQTEAKGAASDMAAILMRGAPGAVKRLASAWEGLLITIAKSGVLDSVSRAMEGITAAINRVAQVSPALLRLGTYAIMAAAIIGPLALAFGALAPAISAVGAAVVALSGPIGWAIAAAVAGAVLLIANWDKVKAFFSGFGLEVANQIRAAGLMPLFKGIGNAALALGNAIGSVISRVAEFFGLTGKGDNDLTGFFNAGAAAARLLLSPLRGIVKMIKTVHWLASKAINWWGGRGAPGGIKPSAPKIAGARAHGGPVRGGQTYLVGERGPELFQPSGGGAIVPNHAMRGFGGGGVNIGAPVLNVSINMPAGADANDMIREVKTRMQDELRDAFYGAISDTGIA